MSKGSSIISEVVQELSSQRASLEDTLCQITFAHESFELQANQASEDIHETVAQQISELNQQKERLLLQVHDICETQGKQLKAKEENLRESIAVLSSALDKIEGFSQSQIGEINQRELQQCMAQLFHTVKETIDGVDNLDQQNLCCQLNTTKLQEVITKFGEINIVGSKEAECETSEVMSSMKATVNTILSSCLGVNKQSWFTDDIHMWLANTQVMNVDLSATEAVLQGLRKQSEKQDLVWLLEQPATAEQSSFHDVSVTQDDGNDGNSCQYWLFSGSETSDGQSTVKNKTGQYEFCSSDMCVWLSFKGKLGITVDQEEAVDSNHLRMKEDELEREATAILRAESFRHSLKQLEEESRDWSQWIYRGTSEACTATKSLSNTINMNSWQAFLKPQSDSYAAAIATGMQSYFSSPLTKWLRMPSKPSDGNVSDSEMSTQQQPTEAVTFTCQTFKSPDYSLWLTASRGFENSESSGDLDMWLALPKYASEYTSNQVAQAFERLRTNESDYTKWLLPDCTVETPVTSFMTEQSCALDQWLLSGQDAAVVTGGYPSGASLLGFGNSLKSSHLHWLMKSDEMQKSLIADSQDLNTGHLIADEMAQVLKKHDESAADISQWLAPSVSGLDLTFEDDSANNDVSHWIVHREWSKNTSEQLPCKSQPFEFDDLSLWLYPQGYKSAESSTSSIDEFKNIKFCLSNKSVAYPHADVDPNNSDEIVELESNATSQDFEIIDQFSKSSHSSLDDTWLHQSEQ
ncbi:uncharacterized protein LOC134184953 [Corticium candelabrum]|uniref:uncharacterized protein LOC134184953 n=1 Tax=Corticium candelabrum TaxID=121492 RepID=UPI002E30A5E4|nr:uncharacterized protein LOC134184953 [Corticium candelabrum]